LSGALRVARGRSTLGGSFARRAQLKSNPPVASLPFLPFAAALKRPAQIRSCQVQYVANIR
jgi:hypothetical protein